MTRVIFIGIVHSHYFFSTWAVLVIFCHLLASFCRYEVNWDAVFSLAGVNARFLNWLRVAGSFNVLLICVFNNSITSSGVPLGAINAKKATVFKPGKPASSVEGTSGKNADRS